MKRWLGLFTVLAAVALVAITLAPRMSTLEDRFDAIHEGMSEAEVRRLMVKPPHEGFEAINDRGGTLLWISSKGDALLVVSFGADRLVSGKAVI